MFILKKKIFREVHPDKYFFKDQGVVSFKDLHFLVSTDSLREKIKDEETQRTSSLLFKNWTKVATIIENIKKNGLFKREVTLKLLHSYYDDFTVKRNILAHADIIEKVTKAELLEFAKEVLEEEDFIVYSMLIDINEKLSRENENIFTIQ